MDTLLQKNTKMVYQMEINHILLNPGSTSLVFFTDTTIPWRAL